ncbi:MAG TPA: O-antigen ligase family protein [bacterium]|nr:O-antigen ligase family protein [bacterium]
MLIKRLWLGLFSIFFFSSLVVLALMPWYLTWILIFWGIVLILGVFTIQPILALYVLILSLPLINLSFTAGGFSLSLPEALGVLAVLAFFLQQLFFWARGQNPWSQIKWPLLLPFLLFLAAALISSLMGDYILFSFWYSLRWLLFFYLAYIFFPYNVIKNGDILRRAIIMLVISGLAIALMGVASLYYQDWYNAFFRVQPIAVFGVWPLGYNHNLIAEFLVIITFFVLALKYWYKSLRTRRFFDILFIFLLLVTVATFSRTAWIVLGLEIALYFVVDNFYIHARAWSSKQIIMMIVVGLLVLTPFIMRMDQLQESNTSSTENRWLLTQIAYTAFTVHPVFGYGPGMFVNLVEDNVRFGAKYGDPLDSHGVGQKVLAEMGAVGVLAFVFFLWSIFSQLILPLKKYQAEKELLLPLGVGALGGIAYQFFNTSYYKGKLWVPVAIALVAVALVTEKYRRREKK